MKSRLLSLVASMLTLPLAAACGMPVFYKNDARKAPKLQFRKDGTFRILHLTDIHEVDPEMDDDEDAAIPRDKSRETVNVIEKSIEKTDPDLVVFGGDNLSGYWEEFTYEYVQKTINKITAPIRKRGIPFAIVFGNHDSELSQFFREFQMCCYLRYENCIGTLNAAEMHGCGNQNILIYAADGSKPVFNLWLMDSNDYPHDETGKKLNGYDRLHDDQLAWYERTAEALRAQNGGEPLPAMLFQHIPVNQETDLLTEVPAGTQGAVERG